LLVDALLLTAAVALGIAGTRHVWDRWSYAWFWNLQDGWSPVATLGRLSTVIALQMPTLAAMSLAILIARFVPPRPRWTRIARQPGVVACGIAVFVVALETVGRGAAILYFETLKGYPGATWNALGFGSWFLSAVLLAAPYPIAYATFAGWAILWLSKRLSPERSWVDRAGVLLGLLWIVSALLFWFNERILGGKLPGAFSL
jgi:hypothetical protein